MRLFRPRSRVDCTVVREYFIPFLRIIIIHPWFIVRNTNFKSYTRNEFFVIGAVSLHPFCTLDKYSIKSKSSPTYFWNNLGVYAPIVEVCKFTEGTLFRFCVSERKCLLFREYVGKILDDIHLQHTSFPEPSLIL